MYSSYVRIGLEPLPFLEGDSDSIIGDSFIFSKEIFITLLST
jgi:hypothetical protein